MRIAVIHGNDGSDVRVGKTCRSLSKMGYDVYFIGWDRTPDSEKQFDLGNTSKAIIRHATQYGRWNLYGQIIFLLHITKTLRKIRPDVVCCVNEELTFLILPLRGISYKHMVCDIYDSPIDRLSHRNWLIRTIVWLLSTATRKFADRLIVTDERRFARIKEKLHNKCIIVENAPEDPGEELSKIIPQGKIKIYVTGSLGRDKGLEYLVKAVESIEEAEIISAGWPYYDYAKNVFIKHPKVTYKGIVTLKQSLELAANCDIVLSFYAPVTLNNKYASPNKIYDAMSVGRPVIINPEIIVADWVNQNNLGFICKYGDVEHLRQIILSLKDKRRELPEFSARVRDLYVRNHTWEQMEIRLKNLYTNITCNK